MTFSQRIRASLAMPTMIRLFLALSLQAAPVNCLFSAFNEASAWDDFVNNVATDLAPIIALFGEQPTKQFLSESTTYLDSIIFAMAPIGVITTIVSVIRLYGTASLRSLIGRAKEPRALAEAELCSSTSDDVCELWSNGGICRVYGQPKLLEFIYDKDAKPEEFYPKFKKGNGPRGIDTTLATCGIHLPRQFFEYPNSRDERIADAESLPSGNGHVENWTRTNPDYLLFGSWLRHTRVTQGEQATFAPHPNLAINIGIRNADRRWIWIVGIFGGLLQGSVLGYALWANWHSPFYTGGGKPSLEFVILTLTGTIFLVIGTGLSARLIDGKSEEQTYISKGKPLRFYWLQAGGQRIGDQVFDAFAYTEEMKEYITSWRISDDRLNSLNSPRLAFLAVTLSFVGWIAQFIGLRGQHGTVALFQLLGTLTMSFFRGLLRGNRMNPERNLLDNKYKNLEGHELDWQALNLPVLSNQNERNRPGFLWLLVESSKTDPYPDLAALTGLESQMSREAGVATLVLDHHEYDPSVLGSAIVKHSSFLENSHNSAKFQEPDLPGRGRAAVHYEELSRGAKLMHLRMRLSNLTSENELLHLQTWHTSVREVAARLRDALEKAATYMFTPQQSGSKWPWDSMTSDALIWSAICQVHQEKITDASPKNLITFSISKYKGRWEVDQNGLEAVLGLWSWSVERLHQRGGTKENETLASRLNVKRLIVGTSESDEYLSMLQGWVSHNYNSQPLERGQRSLLSIPATISMFYNENQATFGLQTIWLDADSPLLCIMAQDIFALFLQRASYMFSKGYGKNPQGNAALRLSQGFFRNSHVESFIDILNSTKLATREEALMSVVPALWEAAFLPRHHSILFTLLSQAHKLRVQDQFRECENILLQLSSLGISGLEVTIQRATRQLCLAECSWTMANLWKVKRSEVFDWLRGSVPRLVEGFWTPPISMENVKREMESIKKSYTIVVRWLISELRIPMLKPDPNDHICFGLSPKGPEDSTKQPITQFPYDKKPSRDYGYILALTFQHRFDIYESAVQDRKQVLRWAIEFGYPELVECLWKLEKSLQLKESAFSGGPDEVFWTINASYDSFIKIDILHFLVTFVEPNLTNHGGGFYACNDENIYGRIKGEEAEQPFDENQIFKAFCKAFCKVHSGWEGSHNTQSLKRMHKAYQDYGNVLTAAVAAPDSSYVVKLLVEHGGLMGDGELQMAFGKMKLPGPSSKKYPNLLVAAVNCSDSAIVKYLTKIYPKRKEFHTDFYLAIGLAGKLGRADCFEYLVRKLDDNIDYRRTWDGDLRIDYQRIEDAANKAGDAHPSFNGQRPFQSDFEGVKEFYERWKSENPLNNGEDEER